MTSASHAARTPIDDFAAFLEAADRGERIVAVVAPAAASSFPDRTLNLNGWMASIGVRAVFDVSFGAELTVQSYVEHIRTGNPQCVIAQPCPALVTFIQIYHPELIPYLAPADSPMMHTMKMIRSFFPEYADHRVAVVSPCVAKRREFDQVGIGDFNVTIRSIHGHFEKNGLSLDMFPPRDFDNPPAERAVLFSSPGGLMRTAEREVPGIGSRTRKIEGPHTIYPYLEGLKASIDAGTAPLLIDCLSCEKGCNGGPGTLNRRTHPDTVEAPIEARARRHQETYRKKSRFGNGKKDAARLHKYVEAHWNPEMYRREYDDFSDHFNLRQPDKQQLEAIYNSTYKTKEEDFLNCSSCGYRNCEEMAIALFNGLTKPENCRHFKEHAVAHETQSAIEAHEKLEMESVQRMAYMKNIAQMIEELFRQSEEIEATCGSNERKTGEAAAGVNRMAGVMARLKESTQQIGSVLEIVGHIAEQSHILGLNATIEATRAGDSGKGFEVVAQEIQKLAQDTNIEIGQIRNTLKTINKHAEETANLSVKSCDIMNEIKNASKAISKVVQEQTSVIATIAEESKSLLKNR